MRTKGFKRKISNVLLLVVLLAIVVGIYYNVYNSKAENMVEIAAMALDNYGYLEEEEFNLEAKDLGDDLYEIEMPESVNSKKVLEVVQITLKDKEAAKEEATADDTATIDDAVSKDDATEENIATEDTETDENSVTDNTITDNTATADTNAKDTTTDNAKLEDAAKEDNTNEEAKDMTTENNTAENTEGTIEAENATEETEKAEESENTEEEQEEKVEVLEIKDNKIQLTKEQIETKDISVEVKYDMAILETTEEGKYQKDLLSEKTEEERAELEITEETQVLYSKILKYEDEENEKIVELKGYLPKDAQLQVEPVTQDKITEIFGDKKIAVAYDIKIIIEVEKEVLVDEEDPEGETEIIIEKIEINPEEFGETCEVSITDSKIVEKSKVYHVKEDNTYEEVTVKENVDETVSFDATTFSMYAVSEEEEISTAAVGEPTVIPSSSTSWLGSGTTLKTSGLTDGVTWHYKWSTNGEEHPAIIVDNILYSGSVIPVPKNAEGTYYLYIQKEWDSSLYQNFKFGPYKIDSKAPDGGINGFLYDGTLVFSDTWINHNSLRLDIIGGEDNGSGVDYCYYKNYNGNRIELEENEVAHGPAGAPDGVYEFYYECADKAGNVKSQTYIMKIDMTKPTIGTPSPGSDNKWESTKTVGVKLSDNLSGINTSASSVKFSWYTTQTSGGSSAQEWIDGTTYYFTSTASRGGVFYLGYTAYAVDKAGNTNSKSGYSGPYYIDKIAPTTPTYTAFYHANTSTSYTSGTWTNKQVDTKISTSDAHSGVTKIQYSSDQSTWTDLALGASGGLVKSGTSTYGTESWTLRNRDETFYFRAVDAAGNASAATSAFNIKYDITNPTGPLTASATVTNQSTVTLYLAAADTGGSGLGHVEINGWYGSTWVTYYSTGTLTYDSTNKRYYATFTFDNIKNTSTALTGNGDGVYGFNAHVYDNAGNHIITSIVNVTYDTRSPNITFGTGAVTDGLIRHYDADNNTGAGSTTTTTWKNLAGNYDGTISGATWGSSSGRYYLNMDGTDDYVNCGITSGLSKFTLDMTFSMDTIPEISEIALMANYHSGGMGLELINRIPNLTLHLGGSNYVYLARTKFSKYRRKI